MEITITVPQDMAERAARRAVEQVFGVPTGQWGGNGDVAYDTMLRQARTWASKQDYAPYILKIAEEVMEETIRAALTAAIRSDVRRIMKQMRDNGELDAIVEGVVRRVAQP